eukprot:gene11398-4565_t
MEENHQTTENEEEFENIENIEIFDLIAEEELFDRIKFDSMPIDTQLHIISFMDKKTICGLECVSKKWKFSELSCDNLFWKSFSTDCIEYHNSYCKTTINIDDKIPNIYKDTMKISFHEQLKLMENYNPLSVDHKYIGADILNFCYSRIKLPPPERKYPVGYQIPSTNELKFVMIGDSAAGKTCLLLRKIRKKFPKDYIPTVFDEYSEIIKYGKEKITANYWDTVTAEVEREMINLKYRCTTCFILCFSVINRINFVHCLKNWIPELRYHYESVPILLVGTMSDMRSKYKTEGNDVIEKNEAINMAVETGCIGYIETSALEGKNVEKVMKCATTASCYQNNTINEEQYACNLQ